MAALAEARDRLRARGLLDDDFNITEAGHAYADQMIASLRRTPAIDGHGSTVKWNMGRFDWCSNMEGR